MVEKPEYRAIIQPVSGLSEAKQKEMLARFEPAEVYVCRTAGDFDAFARQMRPPRVALVCFSGLLGEQRGKKLDRVDSMVAMKAAIHKRGCHVVEVGGRDSRKSWAQMKRDGEDMCRRLAQGAKSALNARRGAKRLADQWSDTDIRDMLRVKESRKYPNWRTRLAAMKKLGINPLPGRTTFIEKLEHIARERGLLD